MLTELRQDITLNRNDQTGKATADLGLKHFKNNLLEKLDI